MRALIQRVTKATVTIDGQLKGAIDGGFCIFLGVGKKDSESEADKLWHKIRGLRIFRDAEGKTNLSLDQVGGNILLISQFTLWADCSRGFRPSFIHAAGAEQGEKLYEYMKTLVAADFPNYQCGSFGAEMKVELLNDGPFTIWLDTDML